MTNEKGYIMISAMLVLCLLTIIGISAIQTSTNELNITTNSQIYHMNFYAAESGLAHSVAWLQNGGVKSDDYKNPDFSEIVNGNLSNKTSYSAEINHVVNEDGEVLLYGDSDGDYLWEVNTINGRPLEIVTSDGTHVRGGNGKVQARYRPLPPFVIPEAALWVHSNVNGNGVSGAIVGEGPSDDSLFGKSYYDSDYSCPAVPDIKYHVAMPNIDYDGNTGESKSYEQTSGLYPLALLMENLIKQADEQILALPGNKFPAGTNLTNSIVVIDMEDAKISQNVEGSGILVCTGNLEISGNLKWKGLILVNGDITFNGGGASNATMVEGSVVALGDAIAINGSVDIVYNCEVISDLYENYFRYKMLSWKQL